MATQVTDASSGVQDKVQGTTSGMLASIQGRATWIASSGQAFLDRLFPPEQRSAILAKLQSFMLANPKLSVGSSSPTFRACELF